MNRLIAAIQKMPESYKGVTKDGSWFVMGFDPDTCFSVIIVNAKNCYSRSFRDQREWQVFKTDLQELLL